MDILKNKETNSQIADICGKVSQDGLKTALRAEKEKERAWRRIWSRAKPAAEPRRWSIRRPATWSVMARVAAVVVPLLVMTVFVARVGMGGADFTHYAAAASADTIQLADGSTVILGKGSELDFRMTKSGREARLCGIALFRVRHDEGSPFTVDASNAEVRVLGTTFSVEHWPGEERVRTRVEQGLVSMSAKSDEVKIKAGEEAIWTGESLTKSASAAGVITIDARRMEFRSASLRQVVDEMLTCYHGELRGVRFEASEDTILITTSFVDQSLESVVDELNLHFDKKLALHNGYLTISD